MDLFLWVLKDQLEAKAIFVNLPFISINAVKVKHKHSVGTFLFHHNKQILCVWDECCAHLYVLTKRRKLNSMEQLSVIKID